MRDECSNKNVLGNVRYIFLPLAHINYRKFDSVSDTFAAGTLKYTLLETVQRNFNLLSLVQKPEKKEIDFCFFSLGKYESEQQ